MELTECNIEVFRRNTLPDEPVTVRQGDARDLSDFDDETYDIALLLGPMYHLYTREDAMQALREALRVTKPVGVVFVSYCMTDPSIIGYGFKKGHIHELLEDGLVDPVAFLAFSEPKEIFQLYRKADIDEMMGHLTVSRLHFVATDGYTHHMPETVDAMDDDTFDVYLRYHFAICELPELVGWSHHTLDVFRKKCSAAS